MSIKNCHIKDDDNRAFVFGDDAPLFENFSVVSVESVNAFDNESIASFKFAQQFFILRTVKVLSALLIDEDLVNAEVLKRDDLSVFALIFRRNPCVPVVFYL